MTTMPEAGRVAAHALLDAMYERNVTSGSDAPPLEDVLDRLSSMVGAMEVTVAESPGQIDVEVDWGVLAGSTFVLLQWFMDQLMNATGLDPHTAITGAREYIDRLEPAAMTIIDIQPAKDR
jgi:hypothetical protein